MAKQLSKETIEAIINDIDLSAKVTKIIGLKKVTGLYDALKRNGNNINRYDTLVGIAQAMGKTIEEIQEEVPEAAA